MDGIQANCIIYTQDIFMNFYLSFIKIIVLSISHTLYNDKSNRTCQARKIVRQSTSERYRIDLMVSTSIRHRFGIFSRWVALVFYNSMKNILIIIKL